MQIMPSNYSESIDNPYLGGSTTEGDTSFADEMQRQQDARDAIEANESHSVEVALEPIAETQSVNSTPYTMNSDDGGVTYTADEVFFTKKELEELLAELKGKGITEENLAELKKLAGQPDGATLHQVLSSFYNHRDYQELNDIDAATLRKIANKLDPSGSLSDSLMADAYGKDGEKFLNNLIASMDDLNGKRITLDKSDMLAIAKAAGLSEDATKKIMSSFGPYDSLQFNKSELSTFLAPGFQDFANEKKDLAKLDKALDETLGPILREARARMEKEKEAYALSLRSAEQSRIVIEETVLESVNRNLERARANQANIAHAETEQAEAVANAKATADVHNSKQTRASASDNFGELKLTKDDATNLRTQLNAELNNNTKDNYSDTKNDNNSGKKQDTPLNNLLSKTEVSQAPSNNINTPLMGIGGLVQATNTSNVAMQQASGRELLSQQAANQVEKAMLTASQNGTRRLDLELHPAELGAVTISLTSRNGELNALIRSEKPETTELLHRQLDQIRSALEQQGLKVEKLEVQTQTSENNSQSDMWDSMQEHNARQEENARRDIIERLRNLGKVRNDATNMDATTLEHSMQLNSHTAIAAGQPLHIVA